MKPQVWRHVTYETVMSHMNESCHMCLIGDIWHEASSVTWLWYAASVTWLWYAASVTCLCYAINVVHQKMSFHRKKNETLYTYTHTRTHTHAHTHTHTHTHTYDSVLQEVWHVSVLIWRLCAPSVMAVWCEGGAYEGTLRVHHLQTSSSTSYRRHMGWLRLKGSIKL